MRSLFLLAIVSVACGGQIAGVDGGEPSDGGGPDATMPDVIVTPACSPASASITQTQGGCQLEAAWGCGTAQYMVQCSCPAAQCSCNEQSGATGSTTTIAVPSACPACSSPTASLAQLCGFPH